MTLNEERENELKDVELCYKGLGIPFDSSPEDVERAYRSLTDKFNKDMLSADSSKRLKAKEDVEIVNNLYEKIRYSVNYQRSMKERSSTPDEYESTQRRSSESIGTKIIFKICPCCNNTIKKSLKVCPYCKKRIYSSKIEKIWVENISNNMVMVLSILSCLTLIALIAINFKEIMAFISNLKK